MTKSEAANILEAQIGLTMRALGIPSIVISVDMGDDDHMAWWWPGADPAVSSTSLADAEVFEEAAEELMHTARMIREGTAMQRPLVRGDA